MPMDLFIILGVIVGLLVLIVVIYASRYVTVRADEALIVTGSALGRKHVVTDANGRKIKIIRGGGFLSSQSFNGQKGSACFHINLMLQHLKCIRNKAFP